MFLARTEWVKYFETFMVIIYIDLYLDLDFDTVFGKSKCVHGLNVENIVNEVVNVWDKVVGDKQDHLNQLHEYCEQRGEYVRQGCGW